MSDIQTPALDWMATTVANADFWEVVVYDTSGVEITRKQAVVTAGGSVIKWFAAFEDLSSRAKTFQIVNTAGIVLTSFSTVATVGGVVEISFVTQLGATCEDCSNGT